PHTISPPCTAALPSLHSFPTRRSSDLLALTAQSLRAPLSFLTPVQSTCNYVTLFLRNIASVVSEVVRTGTALRFAPIAIDQVQGDRKSTRLNSSHVAISYAVFCLKKKK